jgi:hypothetical protein
MSIYEADVVILMPIILLSNDVLLNCVDGVIVVVVGAPTLVGVLPKYSLVEEILPDGSTKG